MSNGSLRVPDYANSADRQVRLQDLGGGEYAVAVSLAGGIEKPENVALVRGGSADATVQVEFWDAYGKTVAVGGASSKALTISSTAKSLDKFLVDASVSGGVPSGAVGGRVLVLTNTICVNTGGSDDGSGTNGFESAALAPTSNSPRRYSAGDAFDFGSIYGGLPL